MDLAIIDCNLDEPGGDNRFLVVTPDQEILANCVSREIAEKLVIALASGQLRKDTKNG